MNVILRQIRRGKRDREGGNETEEEIQRQSAIDQLTSPAGLQSLVVTLDPVPQLSSVVSMSVSLASPGKQPFAHSCQNTHSPLYTHTPDYAYAWDQRNTHVVRMTSKLLSCIHTVHASFSATGKPLAMVIARCFPRLSSRSAAQLKSTGYHGRMCPADHPALVLNERWSDTSATFHHEFKQGGDGLRTWNVY